MNNLEYQTELIEKYITKNISYDEKVEFDQLLSDDTEFKKLYNELDVLITGIKSSARKSMTHRLKELESTLPEIEIKKSGISKRTISWIGTAIAAACMVGILWTVGVFSPENSVSYAAIYSDYYKPYPNVVVSNNRGENKTLTAKEDAFLSYDEGDYNAAIGKFSTLYKESPDPIILFYLANAYMANGQMQNAQQYFLKVLENGTVFIDQSKWLLAISYLKSNEPEKGRELLDELKSYNNAYKQNASDILKLIKTNH